MTRQTAHLAGRAALILLLAASPLALAADSPSLTSAWTHITRLRYADALTEFRAAPASPESHLGIALALLNTQPTTTSNIDQAATILSELRASPDPATSAPAAYLLARLETLHRQPPRFDAALAIYADLIARHPAHPLAQQAVVKAGALRVFSASPQALPTIFAEVETTGATLTTRDARSDFHLMLADSATLLKLPDDLILKHLLAARSAGITRRKAAADNLVRIARTAENLRNTPLARTHYEIFLAEFPRDQRAFYIRECLANLSTPSTGEHPQK